MERANLVWAAVLLVACGPRAGSESTDGSQDGGESESESDSESESGGEFTGPDAFAPFAKSGSRLEFRGYRASGVEFVVEAYDRELDLMCEVSRIGETDDWACLPYRLQPYSPGVGSYQCKTGCVGRLHGRDVADSDCPPPLMRDDDRYYRMEPVEVDPQAVLDPGVRGYQLEFFERGEEIDVGAFARGTVTRETNRDGFGVSVWTGDDASRRVVGLWSERWGEIELDGASKEPMTLQLTPGGLAWGYLAFSDAACTADVVCLNAPPDPGVGMAQCFGGPGSGYCELGPAYDGPVFQNWEGPCESWVDSPWDGEDVSEHCYEITSRPYLALPTISETQVDDHFSLWALPTGEILEVGGPHLRRFGSTMYVVGFAERWQGDAVSGLRGPSCTDLARPALGADPFTMGSYAGACSPGGFFGAATSVIPAAQVGLEVEPGVCGDVPGSIPFFSEQWALYAEADAADYFEEIGALEVF